MTIALSTRIALLAAAAGISAAVPARAQTVLSQLPATQVPPEVVRDLGAAENSPQEFVLFPRSETELDPNSSPFQWGWLALRPHAVYDWTYGNGLQAAPGEPRNSTFQQFAPGLLADLGDHWTIDYTPTWSFYSNPAFRNSVDESVNLMGAVVAGEWAFTLAQSYASTAELLVETAAQTQQRTDGTTVTASRSLSPQMQYQATFIQNLQSASGGYQSSADWSLQQGIQYRLATGVVLNPTALFGYTDIVGGNPMDYARVRASANWMPDTKLTLEVHAGAEHRVFLHSGIAPLNTPLAGGSLQWRPFEQTSVQVEADRNDEYAYLEAQVDRTTVWSVTAEQRLLQHFLLGGMVSWNRSDLAASVSALTLGEASDTRTYSVRLGTTFLRRGIVTVSWGEAANSSNLPGYGFSSHQYALEAGYRY